MRSIMAVIVEASKTIGEEKESIRQHKQGKEKLRT